MLSAAAMAQAQPQQQVSPPHEEMPSPQQEVPPAQQEASPTQQEVPPPQLESQGEPATAPAPIEPTPTSATADQTAPATEAPKTPEAAASPAQAPPASPPPNAQAAASAQAEQKRFEQFRRDLISLLALRADADLLVAAAELAFPDSGDKSRTAALKSPSLIKRAQKFGPDVALVWWVSTFVECGTKGASCHGEAAAQLQQLDGSNAAAWLPALHGASAPGQARALLASMAQATRFDDFWTAGVLAMFRALQTLPVPEEVLGNGLNPTAARVNMATSVGGGFMANYARLGDMCRKRDDTDETLIADCLAVAHLFESGGSFRSQSIGFAIEDSLLPPGTARDLLRARQRASAWQRLQFLEVSARFGRDEALTQTFVDLLRENGNELTAVTALLRSQHLSTEPPAGWQPPQANPDAVARDPAVMPPAH
jgi:hypothetical protein